MRRWQCADGNDYTLHRFDGTLKLRGPAAQVCSRITKRFRRSLDALAERLAAPVRRFLSGKLASVIAQYKLPLALRIPGRSGIELCGAIHGGSRISEQIEKAGYDVFRERPVLAQLTGASSRYAL
ncbi:hypothetical protein LMG28690_06304 [Paraburkholderia caffeinilytica]|nr:hypothetical protein LMG28690_06304 [Paraburkholderia caffeinilytica]